MTINLEHQKISGETTVKNAITEVAAMMGENVKEAESESESVKGLTDNAIHQRIDYHVKYEEAPMESESRMSDKKGRFHF